MKKIKINTPITRFVSNLNQILFDFANIFSLTNSFKVSLKGVQAYWKRVGSTEILN